MALGDRATQMARSVSSAARGHGMADDGVAMVERTLALAMGERVAALSDDHHPAYLHPGRTMLVLLHDVGPVDVATLVVAGLHESTDLTFSATPHDIAENIGPTAVGALASIPLPGDERLIERLLGLGEGVALAALAEQLDQLRHMHLRPDLVDGWAGTHAEVAEAWLPFAARTHPTLARRYAHWVRTFARRIEGGG